MFWRNILTVTLLACGLLWLGATSALAAGGPPSTIAVLDLQALQVDKTKNNLGAEVSLAIAWKLQSLPGLDVVPRWEIARIQGKALENPPGVDSQLARTWGRRVGARWVVSGNFTSVADQLQLKLILVDTLSGQTWESGLTLITTPEEYLADLGNLLDRLAPLMGYALTEDELSQIMEIPTTSRINLAEVTRLLVEYPELEANRPEQLTETLTALLTGDGNFVEAAWLLALVLHEEGEIDEAIVRLETAVKARPSFAPGWLLLRELYLEQNEQAKAAQALEKIIEVAARTPSVARARAQALLEAGNTNEAARVLRELLVSAPEDGLAHLLSAEVALAQNNLENALNEMKAALGLPGISDYLVYVRIAEAQEHFGNTDEALDAYSQAAAKSPGNPWALLRKADLLLKLERNQEALETLLLAFDADREYYWTHIALARAYQALGQLDQAERFLTSALKLDAKRIEAHFYYGWLLFDTERWQDAATQYELVLKILPGHQAATYNLALTYLELDRKPEAIALLEGFLKTKPPAEWQESANKLLQKLKTPG